MHVYDQTKGVVNSVTLIATIIALIDRSQHKHFKYFDLKPSSWGKSLFRGMGFVKCICAMSKLGISKEATIKDAMLLFQHWVTNFVEGYSRP